MRKFWWLIVRLYLLAGVLLTSYAFLAVGCVSSDLTIPQYDVAAEITSVESARTALRAARTSEYQEAWEDEALDPETRALVAFRIAQETGDPAWSSDAVERFENLVEQDGADATALVYLGASHALVARDYPIQGVLQVIPGPGFVRLYHVNQAFKYLDDAIAQDDMNPVARLVRAATSVGLTSFGGDEQGLADFELLMQWSRNPQLNPEHQNVIASDVFQSELWLAYAGALERLDRNQEAKAAWRRVEQLSADPLVQELASWEQR